MLLQYKELDGYDYITTIDITFFVDIPVDIDTKYISIHNGIMLIRSGYAWDGPSGIAIHTYTFMHGSLAHDALYQLMREGLLSRVYKNKADLILKRICEEHGMNKFRAWYVYHTVKLFGKRSTFPSKNPRGKIVEIL